MARSAFTGGLFPTLQNHIGPLQGVWGHCMRGTNKATVCQTAANDRLGLPRRLWLFLCPTEDTLLLSVSLWMV